MITGCTGHHRWAMLVAVATATVAARPTVTARADDAADPAAAMVESIYGADLRRVASTADRGDDADLARRMIASAADLADNPAAAALLCTHAHRLTATIPAERQTAIDAMTRVMELDPTRRAECLAALVTLYEDETRAARGDERATVARQLLAVLEQAAAVAAAEGRYDDADRYYKRALGIAGLADADRRPWLLEQSRAMRDMLALIAEADRLMTALADKPDDADAGRRLVRTLLELDRMGDARKYSFLTDEATAKLIVQAAAPPSELDATQTIAVADWYLRLADEAKATAAASQLKRRALRRYELALASDAADAATRQRATLAASKLRQDLGPDAPPVIAPPGGANPAEAAAGGVIKLGDLLTGTDPDDGREWRKKDNVYTFLGLPGRGELPSYFSAFDQSPEKSYTVTCDIRWHDETEAAGVKVCATGRSPTVFINGGAAVLLGVGGQPVGYEVKEPFAVGQWHRFRVSVMEKGTRTQIEMHVDDKLSVRWAGETRELSAPPGGEVPAFIGIGMVARRNGTEFRDFTVKVHSGTLKAVPERR